MQIVIDIDDVIYKDAVNSRVLFDEYVTEVAIAIIDGTPLPERHGRLIDADDIALIDEEFYVPSDYYVAESAINDAPTIIEGSESG